MSGAASYLPVKVLKEDLPNCISMSLLLVCLLCEVTLCLADSRQVFRSDVKQSPPDKSEIGEFCSLARRRQLHGYSNSSRNCWVSLSGVRRGSEQFAAHAPWSAGGLALGQAWKFFLCGCEGSL